MRWLDFGVKKLMLDEVCDRLMVEVGNKEIKDFVYFNFLYFWKLLVRNIFWYKR